MNKLKKVPKGKRPIFRAWILKDGKKLYAKDYGYKAWPIWV
jgi:hypothetical protein